MRPRNLCLRNRPSKRCGLQLLHKFCLPFLVISSDQFQSKGLLMISRLFPEKWCRRTRLIGLSAALLASLFAGQVSLASSASATSGTVTVTVTTNQCPQGGNVARIWYSIDQGGVVNGASGDTASTWSQLGVLVHITGTAYCNKGIFGSQSYYWNFYQIPRYFNPGATHTYI